MKKAKKALGIILIAIMATCFCFALFRFTRPKVNVVLTSEEAILYKNAFPQGLFSKHRVKTTVYPETEDNCYYLYSPLAGLALMESEKEARGAIFGLSKDYDAFSLIFLPDEEGRWRDAYRETGTALLSAVIYEESERALVASAPDAFLRYSYENTISRVGAEELGEEMRRSGVSNFIIYSPWNTLEFLSLDEGYTFTLPILFRNVMEKSLNASYASEDFSAMFDLIISGAKGEVETPYKLLERKNRIEVFLDKLF